MDNNYNSNDYNNGEYNNNLEDFLKNKLETFDDTTVWDRPDEATKSLVLKQLQTVQVPNSKPLNIAYSKWLAVAATTLVVTALGFYVYQLKKQTNALVETVNYQSATLREMGTKMMASEEDHLEGNHLEENHLEEDSFEEKAAIWQLEQEQKIAENQLATAMVLSNLEQELNRLSEQKRALEKEVREIKQSRGAAAKNQENTLQLATENQELRTELKNLVGALKQAKSKQKTKEATVVKSMLENPTVALTEMHPIWPQETEGGIKGIPQKKLSQFPLEETLKSPKYSNFEIGYQHSLHILQMPMLRSFEKQKVTFKTLPRGYDVLANSSGIYVAYAPKKNWWIRTGFRSFKAIASRTTYFDLEYDLTNEYIGEQGTRGNKISFTANTPYASVKNDFDIAIPSDTTLEEKDWFKITVEDEVEFKYTQIPLGLDYFYGKGKLQVLGQVGVQWNRVALFDYNYIATVETKIGEIKTYKDLTIVDREKHNKQFMSAYLGIGINYELSPSWQIRGIGNYAYQLMNSKFLNDNRALFSSRVINSSSAYKLGLHYRFK